MDYRCIFANCNNPAEVVWTGLCDGKIFLCNSCAAVLERKLKKRPPSNIKGRMSKFTHSYGEREESSPAYFDSATYMNKGLTGDKLLSNKNFKEDITHVYCVE